MTDNINEIEALLVGIITVGLMCGIVYYIPWIVFALFFGTMSIGIICALGYAVVEAFGKWR